MNNRRNLLIVLGASVLAAPLGSFAQQPGKVWRIGYLSPGARPASLEAGVHGIFLRGMRDLGYVEGKNFVIEWRFADGKYERLAGLAAELVKLKVDVIVALPSPAIRAAQQATTTIPIIMGNTSDPVGAGFVASLARPGGNITGLSNLGGEISVKHLELLMAMVPKLSRVAVLGNPGSTTHSVHIRNAVTAAQRTDIRIVSVEARTAEDIERGFASMPRERIDAVIVATDNFFIGQRKLIADLAVKYRLPTIHGHSAHPPAGGLMSYAAVVDSQRVAVYVDKIFKGAKPADLPVEQPTRFELIVNRKTAKALGLTIPPEIMVRVDKVIEW
jgi:putative ABC transport system substrate-binding protein